MKDEGTAEAATPGGPAGFILYPSSFILSRGASMIQCPYCGHKTSVKSARAGRFKPKCPACSKLFQVTVSGGAGAGEGPLSFQSEPLEQASGEGVPARAAAQDPNLTSPTMAEAPRPRAAATMDATIAHDQASPSVAGNAEFSVSAPLASSASAVPGAATGDATMAIDPASRVPVAIDSTEAGEDEPAAPVASLGEVPRVLGGYEIVKELGRGGRGAVYLARQVSLDRPVALKVMNPEWAKNPNFLVRFTREAYAAAQLVHHNIVQVYDIGQDRGIHYFPMEYVDGCSLGEVLKKEGKIEAAVAAGYALQAARGLSFAHDRGMIHRDIKPDNLMLNTHGVVKVADLGLVRTPGMQEQLPTEERQIIDEESL